MYLITRLLVAAAFERIGSEAVGSEEKRRYMMRKKYLETFSEEPAGTSKRERSKTYASERHGASPLQSPDGDSNSESGHASRYLSPRGDNVDSATAGLLVPASSLAERDASPISIYAGYSATVPFPSLGSSGLGA